MQLAISIQSAIFNSVEFTCIKTAFLYFQFSILRSLFLTIQLFCTREKEGENRFTFGGAFNNVNSVPLFNLKVFENVRECSHIFSSNSVC